MGYATQQFYNFSLYEGGVGPNQVGDQDNPRFIWPGKTNTMAHTGETHNLQRGYIRMITEAYGIDSAAQKLGAKRFHFQFNPDVLVRSVTARNDVQFWMNQDPGQLVSPIPGDANFAFEFILNREAEMASGKVASGTTATSPPIKPRNPRQQNRTDASGNSGFGKTVTSERDSKKPNEIGVLADLLVFDSIIGQGINQELIRSILKKYDANVKAYESSNTGASAGKTVDGQDIASVTGTAAIATNTLKSAGGGNSAFLISQPVRIVFSSLYMVEGFITSSTVTFNKFNLAMVPTQCTVSINMQAMYIGFAAKDTFLTTTLREANATSADIAEVQDAEVLALNTIVPFFPAFYPPPLAHDAIKPSNFLSKDKDPVELRWHVTRTDDLREAMNKGWVTGISAAIELDIYYVGHTSGTDQGYYQGDLKKTPILTQRVSTVYGHFDTGSRWNPRNWDDKRSQADFGFTWKLARAIPDVSRKWDDRDGAKYRVVVKVITTLDSSGTSSESKQQFVLDNEVLFNNEINTYRFTPKMV